MREYEWVEKEDAQIVTLYKCGQKGDVGAENAYGINKYKSTNGG